MTYKLQLIKKICKYKKKKKKRRKTLMLIFPMINKTIYSKNIKKRKMSLQKMSSRKLISPINLWNAYIKKSLKMT